MQNSTLSAVPMRHNLEPLVPTVVGMDRRGRADISVNHMDEHHGEPRS